MASDALTSEIAQALHTGQIMGYVSCAALTILTYEAVVNLDKELEYIWREFEKKKIPASILTVLRWTPILQLVLPWISSPSTCQSNIVAIQVLYILMCLALALFGALRVHALTHGKLALSISAFLLTGIPPVFTLVTIIASTYVYEPAPLAQCVQVLSLSMRVINILAWTASIFTVAGSTLVLIVTLSTALPQWRGQRGLTAPMSKYAYLLLRDGTFCFGTILAVDVASIVLSSVPSTARGPALYVQSIVEAIPPILICRLILNLQHAHNVMFMAPAFDFELQTSGTGNQDHRAGLSPTAPSTRLTSTSAV